MSTLLNSLAYSSRHFAAGAISCVAKHAVLMKGVHATLVMELCICDANPKLCPNIDMYLHWLCKAVQKYDH